MNVRLMAGSRLESLTTLKTLPARRTAASYCAFRSPDASSSEMVSIQAMRSLHPRLGRPP